MWQKCGNFCPHFSEKYQFLNRARKSSKMHFSPIFVIYRSKGIPRLKMVFSTKCENHNGSLNLVEIFLGKIPEYNFSP